MNSVSRPKDLLMGLGTLNSYNYIAKSTLINLICQDYVKLNRVAVLILVLTKIEELFEIWINKKVLNFRHAFSGVNYVEELRCRKVAPVIP